MDNFHGKYPSPLLTTLSTPLSSSLHVPPPLATLPSSPLSTLIYDPLNSYPTSISVFITFSFFSYLEWI